LSGNKAFAIYFPINLQKSDINSEKTKRKAIPPLADFYLNPCSTKRHPIARATKCIAILSIIL
jgi:hypothetical protein